MTTFIFAILYSFCWRNCNSWVPWNLDRNWESRNSSWPLIGVKINLNNRKSNLAILVALRCLFSEPGILLLRAGPAPEHRDAWGDIPLPAAERYGGSQDTAITAQCRRPGPILRENPKPVVNESVHPGERGKQCKMLQARFRTTTHLIPLVQCYFLKGKYTNASAPCLFCRCRSEVKRNALLGNERNRQAGEDTRENVTESIMFSFFKNIVKNWDRYFKALASNSALGTDAYS